MLCKLCQERGQNWPGQAPTCAFDGDFKNNFRCATLLRLREIVINNEAKAGHYSPIHIQHCETDEKYAVLKVEGIDGIPDEALSLFIGWYKTRGRTQALWLMFTEEDPRRPTEEECLAIIQHYSDRLVSITAHNAAVKVS